jgi:UDP-N-acetylmuramate-alanine ligase
VVMHGIYASAREKPDPELSGRLLFEEVVRRSEAAARDSGSKTRPLFFYEGVLEGREALASFLEPGDLFLTMGAGDNWKLGEALLADKARQTR